MLHRHAAIDREDLAGDVTSGRAGEEEDGVGNVIDLTEIGERDFGHDAGLEVVRELGGHVGSDKSGGDGVAGDFTLQAVNISAKTRLIQVLVNLEPSVKYFFASFKLLFFS